jgi:hypothetical protein
VELKGDDELTAEVLRPDEFFQRFATLVTERDFEVGALETTDISAEAIFEYVMSSSMRF